MDDELIRKEKYRCEAPTSAITVGDLYFKAVNPIYNRQVVLKKGEYILTELLDFNDLKKSRTSGALNQFIRMGWIVVENPAEEIKKNEVKPVEMHVPSISQGLNEVQAGLVNPKNVTNYVGNAAQLKDALGFPNDVQPKTIELVSMEDSRRTNTFVISEQDASKVKDFYTEFVALKYFQKLKTIKETTNIKLLEDIAIKSNYPQLVHNSKNRLRELRGK